MRPSIKYVRNILRKTIISNPLLQTRTMATNLGRISIKYFFINPVPDRKVGLFARPHFVIAKIYFWFISDLFQDLFLYENYIYITFYRVKDRF